MKNEKELLALYENNLKKITELKKTAEQINIAEDKLCEQLDNVNKKNMEICKLMNEISINYKTITQNLI